MITVPPDASPEVMEELRARLEGTLNDATSRADAKLGHPQVTDHG
jgi:hypothetical protein